MIRAFIIDRTGTRPAAVPGWAMGLGAFGAAAIGLTMLVIGAGLALLLAPLAIGAVLLARWRLKSLLRGMAEQAELARADAVREARPADPTVIDGEYRVLKDGR